MQADLNFDAEEEMSADDAGKSSQTKQKCVVAVLLVVLLVVVLRQPDDQDPDVESTATVSLQTDDAAGASEGSDTAASDLSRFVKTLQLSRTALEEVVVSPVFSAERAERAEPPRVPSSRLTVRAVYGSGQQQSAILGDSIVRSGQPLPDGRKVLAVTTEGVQLGRYPPAGQDR